MKAKWDGSLVFTEKAEHWDRQACRGLRVSAIKRLSRWIIVKVAWVKLIAASPFVLPDLSHFFPHTGSEVPECPEERYEQGREKEVMDQWARGRRMVRRRHTYEHWKESKPSCAPLFSGFHSVIYISWVYSSYMSSMLFSQKMLSHTTSQRLYL